MILDTNALSAFADGVPDAVAVIRRAPSVEIVVISLGEYRFGIAGSRRRREYEGWLAECLRICPVLPADEDTSRWYADIRSELKKKGTPIPANDLWIAALAIQHNLPILTRDRHFDNVPSLKRISW